MRLRLFLAASALALLSGCAGLTSHEALEGQGDAQTWKTHKQQLSELDAWQIDGKVGIRAPRDSGSGTLFWLQRQGYYDIRLSGPLGRGAARLTGREGAVSLEVAGQGRYQAESPEALLEEQLGWRLPVSHLLWWVRGLPAPPDPRRRQSPGALGTGRLADRIHPLRRTERLLATRAPEAARPGPRRHPGDQGLAAAPARPLT